MPKLAGFTYRDYRRQMQAAAAGMFAAGLDPAHDKVLNWDAAISHAVSSAFHPTSTLYDPILLKPP